MYLKRLELQGFKSFPEKIRLEFNRGITAVVGPNGSGKSNISDAVRWVLGEQSAKSLRGSKMEDVIFAGTANRRALGFAEVSLIIDNTSGKFPLDYSEIIVTRRVYRSGESEYQINGSACRLKDIHEMFMDTGIGREGYSIIGQGRIDEILSTKSEDRRLLFEEAAGIVKYKNRRQETYAKLEKEKQNLIRVNDIIDELEKQLSPLAEQNEKAKKYLSLAERLKLLQVNIFLNETAAFEKELEETGRAIDDCKTQIDDEEKITANYRKDLLGEKEDFRRIENNIGACGDEITSLQLETEKRENEIKLAEQDTEHLEQNIRRLLKEAEQKREVIHTGLKNKELYITQLNSRKMELQTVNENLRSRQQEMEKLNSSLSENEQLIEKYNTDIIEYMKELSEISSNLNRTSFIIEQLNSRKTELGGEAELNISQTYEKETLLKVLEKHNIETNAVHQRLQNGMDQAVKQRDAVLAEIKTLEEEQVRLEKQKNEQASRLKLLNELQDNYEGYYKSVKSILKRKKSEPEKYKDIHGVVGELISVPKEYETAIETALSGAVQNIVTTDEEAAKEAIEYLKTNNAGRATFLPITSVKPREFGIKETLFRENGVIGAANMLIEYAPVYEGIISSLLGRVLVFDNLENAISFSKKYGYTYKIVTLEGDLINVGGAMTGGSVVKSASNIFSRGREITALTEELRLLAQKSTGLKAKNTQKTELINKYIEEIESATSDIQEIKLEISGQVNRIEQIKSDLNNLKEKHTNQETEAMQLERQLEIIINEKISYETQKSENENSIEEIKNSLERYQSSLQQRKELSRQQINEMTDLRIHISRLEQEVKSTKENISRIEAEAEALRTAIRELENEVSKARSDIELNKKKTADTSDMINEIKQELKNKNDYMAQLVENKEKCRIQITSAEKKIEEKTILISELKNELIRLEMKKERVEAENRRKYDYMWEEYELTYQMAKKYEKLELSVAQLQREERETRNAVKELGSVNITAIEEYKAVKERYEFLTRQREDILSAEEKLDSIIKELTAQMEARFVEQFVKISQNFNIVFSEMFGGGSAHLVLCEESNVLESGIEIIAQPPGKLLKNMLLLSGGERALTAIALLFAILRMKPSPFCILDEIEAALDDANVVRFANYLKNFSEDTQFIVITHRKGTMECADAIYGVTMQEQGISKLVSVKFVEEAV